MNTFCQGARRSSSLLLLGVLLFWATLAGCASQVATIEVPKEIRVLVPTPCVDQAKRPARPALRSAEDLMLLDRGRRTLALYSDWLTLHSYAGELEAVVEGCSRIMR